MPIYEYKCKDGHKFAKTVKLSKNPPCPICGKETRKNQTPIEEVLCPVARKS